MSSTDARYRDRVSRVIAHVREHLDEPLDLDRLADVACLSRFHWHRVYRAITGETAAQTVRRLRLARACDELVNTDHTLSTVAARAGYGSDAAFTRAFGRAYGMPPASWRRAGTHAELVRATRERDDRAYAVEQAEIAPFVAVATGHAGRYLDIDSAFERLLGLLHRGGLADRVTGVWAAFEHDPSAVPECDLRSLAIITLDPAVVRLAGVEPAEFGGGAYAVLHHVGPYADMPAAYDWLFGVWLPASGLALRDRPILEHYLDDPKTTPPAELRSDICVPVGS